MKSRSLPPRPNLDQLKRLAKDLLREARAGDSGALARFRALPSFGGTPDAALARAAFALHDAQSVVAREHGFPSWNALREEVEARTLAFDDAVVQFVEAATDGRTDRAERLLSLHPGIATATFHTALVLGDAVTVNAHLAKQPHQATEAAGPRGWEPLMYVCHTGVAHGDDARESGLVSIARELIRLGADPNSRFPWLHHGVRRPVLWGAASASRIPALVALLLESGADPSDGVTFPLAVAAGDIPVLELLAQHGADLDQPWATDGSASLYAALTWAGNTAGAHWLLEHGADPDPVFALNGETPLHVAARQWDVELVSALVARGADPARPSGSGRTPYALAALAGNRAVADWLVAHGADDRLAPVDQLVAACARGDRRMAAELLAAHPSLPDELGEDHYAGLYIAAARGDAEALETLLSAGFDPDHPDESIGKTALHVAAMEGWPGAAEVLLRHGASVSVRDREFKAQPLVWAAEGSRNARDGRDHTKVARLLLDAGSPKEWDAGPEPPEQILEILAEWTEADRVQP